MKSYRHVLPLILAVLFALAASQAGAAPEIHRLNLVLSSNPTQLLAGDLNDFIDEFNNGTTERQRVLKIPGPRGRGLESLGKVSFSWYHQAELRYFLRPNWAVGAGIGQIRAQARREYLPRISQTITLRAEVISVPVHVGATYYLAPYTQGDFQARAYVGGGFMSLTNNKIIFEQLEFDTDSATTLGGSQRAKMRRDGPGYYFEVGGHMFFASRYSVMIGAIYRSAVVRGLHEIDEVVEPNGSKTLSQVAVDKPSLDLDTGGLGVRMGVAIGF